MFFNDYDETLVAQTLSLAEAQAQAHPYKNTHTLHTHIKRTRAIKPGVHEKLYD